MWLHALRCICNTIRTMLRSVCVERLLGLYTQVYSMIITCLQSSAFYKLHATMSTIFMLQHFYNLHATMMMFFLFGAYVWSTAGFQLFRPTARMLLRRILQCLQSWLTLLCANELVEHCNIAARLSAMRSFIFAIGRFNKINYIPILMRHLDFNNICVQNPRMQRWWQAAS